MELYEKEIVVYLQPQKINKIYCYVCNRRDSRATIQS